MKKNRVVHISVGLLIGAGLLLVSTFGYLIKNIEGDEMPVILRLILLGMGAFLFFRIGVSTGKREQLK